MESGVPITFDSKSEVNSMIQVCFGLIMMFFFNGSGVEGRWMLNEHWDKTFAGVAQPC